MIYLVLEAFTIIIKLLLKANFKTNLTKVRLNP